MYNRARRDQCLAIPHAGATANPMTFRWPSLKLRAFSTVLALLCGCSLVRFYWSPQGSSRRIWATYRLLDQTVEEQGSSLRDARGRVAARLDGSLELAKPGPPDAWCRLLPENTLFGFGRRFTDGRAATARRRLAFDIEQADIPENFDWRAYTQYHPWLRGQGIYTETGARAHYLGSGREQGLLCTKLRVILRYTACTGQTISTFVLYLQILPF